MTGAEVATDARPALGLTMFGVTTPCVTRVAELLRADYDCLVFHATGTGGRTLEALADAGELAGVIDVTTTEVCDELFGGVLSAGPDRLGAIARSRVPYVGSCGALDMVNFWAPDTIPERYRDRRFYRHNPNITLMRTTAAECREIGAWIAAKLNACDGPVRFLIPERGVSALDVAGGAFEDPEADAALFDAIEAGIRADARPPRHARCPSTSTIPPSPTRSSRPGARSPQRRPDMPAIPRAEILEEVPRDGRRPASRSSAAAPAPASRPSARRRGASTSS